MSPHRASNALGESLRNGCELSDPGDEGAFDAVPQRAFQYAIIAGGSDEVRYLPNPEAFPAGSELVVIVDSVNTDTAIHSHGGGAINSAGDTIVTHDAAGEHSAFVCVNNNGSKEWHLGPTDGGVAS